MKKHVSALKAGKKALPRAAASAVAAFALALGALFDSPAELLALENDEGDACAQTAAVSVGKRLEPAAGERARQSGAGLAMRLRVFLLGQPAAVRAAVLLPLWCVGRAGIALTALLIRALAPVWQLLLGALLNAFVLAMLLLLIYRFLFPGRSLRSMLTKRNLAAVACCGVAVTVADALLRQHWPAYAPLSVCIRLALGFALLAILCRRIFGKRANRPARAAIAADS